MLLARRRIFKMRSNHTVPIIDLLLTAVLILVVAAQATATSDHYVDGVSGVDTGKCTDSGNPCKTIGYALSKAFGKENIYVAKGTYKENLIITDNINLFGGFDTADWTKEPKQYGSIIDGQKLASVVRYEDGFQGTLDGFKITNGKAAKGGGVYSKYGNVKLLLQKLWITGNEASEDGGGVYFDQGNGMTISESMIENNKAAGNGGAIHFNYGSGTLSGLIIRNNNAGSGGGISLYSTGVVKLDDSRLLKNVGQNQSGAVHIDQGELRSTNCVFAGNSANDHGGAITVQGQYLEIVNGLFYGNRTTAGPASVLAMGDTTAYVVNSTFAGNAPNGHQAIIVWSGFLHLKNSIMWNNALNIQTDPPCKSCVKVTNSDVQGYLENPVQDKNNIDKDPLFRDPSTADFRLKSGSPCINAGSPNGVNPVPPQDIDGNPRGTKPDMGAYEYVAPIYKFKVALPMVTGR